MDRQMTLAEMNDEFGAARTNKKEFLEKMDRIIPWAVIIALVQPFYYKGERGNKPYPLELMLRKGTIVDSTFIEAPSSTKNQKKERDPEAHSSKKGNTWHFGYKAHIGVDRENGLVHHVKTTAANEHDVTAVSDLMHGEEDTLHGDSGYVGAQKRPEAIIRNKKGKKIKYLICRKPSAIQKLSRSGQYAAKKAEHNKSSVRCKVEHVFAVVKKLFGYRKTRYRGLRKQTDTSLCSRRYCREFFYIPIFKIGYMRYCHRS